MNEVLIYIIKVLVIHGLLYLFYRLVLKNSARHVLNRAYLLGALIAAFIIPFIAFTVPDSTQASAAENPVIYWLSEPTMGLEYFEIIPVKQQEVFSFWSLMPIIYVLIATFLVVRSMVYLILLDRLKKHSEHIQKRWFSLFKTSHKRPFSFFSNVFIPQHFFGTDAFRQVLAHECVHVRQLHSVDRLLLDFFVSLFWFNPFIYLYRNALIEIHEYQADEAVINRFNDPIGYQEILFSQLQSTEYSELVSHFNFSLIKKRIVMMNKQKKGSGWVYSLTLPVTLMIVFTFSSKESVEPLKEVRQDLTSLISPITHVSELNQLFQQDNEPSILPIKEASLTRLTSGFGKRMHPITKKEQWHLGVDFSCKVGSEVMATADGVVESVTDNPGGYGKLVTIDHGNEYKTRYAQLSEFKVKEGDEVKKGQVIALSGNSGMSTAPHLHYEVQKGDKRINPLDYIDDYDFKPGAKEIKSEASNDDLKLSSQNPKESTADKNAVLTVETFNTSTGKENGAILSDKSNVLEEESVEQIENSDGTSPIYFLDGTRIEEVSTIQPEDIDHVNVLKGEKAIEKYGEDGRNGVIEITTKKNKVKNESKLK